MRAVAYLDANSGSLIVSAIAAGGAGVAVAAKMGMHRLKKPFSRRSEFTEDETVEADAETTEPEPVAEDA